MKWPTLISLLTAATGFSMAAFPIDSLLHHRPFTGLLADRVAYLLALATVVAFVVLSFFIYLERLWARRALIATLLFSVLSVIISSISQELRTSGGDRFVRIAGYVLVLLLPLAALAVLFQPDVVRAFPPKRTSTSTESPSNT